MSLITCEDVLNSVFSEQQHVSDGQQQFDNNIHSRDVACCGPSSNQLVTFAPAPQGVSVTGYLITAAGTRRQQIR